MWKLTASLQMCQPQKGLADQSDDVKRRGTVSQRSTGGGGSVIQLMDGGGLLREQLSHRIPLSLTVFLITCWSALGASLRGGLL